MNDHYKTLCERRDWLEQRIKAKRNIGWETQYDERENAALQWATRILDRLYELVDREKVIAETNSMIDKLTRIHHPEQARAAKDRDGSSTPKTARRKGRGQRTAIYSVCKKCPDKPQFKTRNDYDHHYYHRHVKPNKVKSPGNC